MAPLPSPSPVPAVTGTLAPSGARGSMGSIQTVSAVQQTGGNFFVDFSIRLAEPPVGIPVVVIEGRDRNASVVSHRYDPVSRAYFFQVQLPGDIAASLKVKVPVTAGRHHWKKFSWDPNQSGGRPILNSTDYTAIEYTGLPGGRPAADDVPSKPSGTAVPSPIPSRAPSPSPSPSPSATTPSSTPRILQTPAPSPGAVPSVRARRLADLKKQKSGLEAEYRLVQSTIAGLSKTSSLIDQRIKHPEDLVTTGERFGLWRAYGGLLRGAEYAGQVQVLIDQRLLALYRARNSVTNQMRSREAIAQHLMGKLNKVNQAIGKLQAQGDRP